MKRPTTREDALHPSTPEDAMLVHFRRENGAAAVLVVKPQPDALAKAMKITNKNFGDPTKDIGGPNLTPLEKPKGRR